MLNTTTNSHPQKLTINSTVNHRKISFILRTGEDYLILPFLISTVVERLVNKVEKLSFIVHRETYELETILTSKM